MVQVAVFAQSAVSSPPGGPCEDGDGDQCPGVTCAEWSTGCQSVKTDQCTVYTQGTRSLTEVTRLLVLSRSRNSSDFPVVSSCSLHH